MGKTLTQDQVNSAVQRAFAADRNRCQAITELGRKYGLGDDANEFIMEGKSVEEFRAHVLNQSPSDLRTAVANSPEALEAAAGDAVAKVKQRRKALYA